MTKQTGTLVFAGSVAWDLTGRKKAPDSEYADPSIYTPASNIPVVSVHTSCTSCHSVLIDGNFSSLLSLKLYIQTKEMPIPLEEMKRVN